MAFVRISDFTQPTKAIFLCEPMDRTSMAKQKNVSGKSFLRRSLAIAAVMIAAVNFAFAQSKQPITRDQARPPAQLLLDCKEAPVSAVVKLPDNLASWATIYCTRIGHIFSPNDRYLAFFPGSSIRGSVNAAEFSGRSGNVGHAAHFKKISYELLSTKAAETLVSQAPEAAAGVLRNKKLYKIEFVIDTGQTIAMIAADPGTELFWVFPFVNGKIGARAFYVTTLEAVNRQR